MPLVRITLRKDLLPETKKAISDAIHKGVMEVFNVTQPDFWHIFNEVEPNNITTSKSYMGVEHGDKAVLITILVGEGRDADKKKTLFASIVKHASELQKEVPPNDIIIIM